MNLKDLRRELGVTQQQLADDLKLSEDYVSMMERGVRLPGRKVAKKLADYFGITVDELLYK